MRERERERDSEYTYLVIIFKLKAVINMKGIWVLWHDQYLRKTPKLLSFWKNNAVLD